MTTIEAAAENLARQVSDVPVAPPPKLAKR
jgi:hypothetical protein